MNNVITEYTGFYHFRFQNQFVLFRSPHRHFSQSKIINSPPPISRRFRYSIAIRKYLGELHLADSGDNQNRNLQLDAQSAWCLGRVELSFIPCYLRLMRMKWVFSLGLASAVLVILAACTTAPVTGRKQLSLVSADQETQLGLSEFDKMKKETPISNDPQSNALVQKVGKRIAAVASKDLPGAQWEFVVFESKEANAFCLPGGKVGVYTGILPITKTEEGLATVLGHEIAHAAAHHGAERMSDALAAQTGAQLAGAAASSYNQNLGSLATTAFPALAQVGVILPFSRIQESEADHIGLIYMARAGYDPKAAVDFWQRFAEYNKSQGGGGGIALLRTHPVDEVRIADLKKWLPEAQAAANGGSGGSSTLGSSVISGPAK